jgi:hypothetical protein
MLRLPVNIANPSARVCTSSFCNRIYPHAAYRGQIDNETAITSRVTLVTVSATTHGNEQVSFTRKLN